MGNTMQRDMDLAQPSDFDDFNIDQMKPLPSKHTASDLILDSNRELSKDEVPEDIRAFFVHPLTAATSALDGEDEESHASALALLHEYQNLPSLDRTDLKMGERHETLGDILRNDLRRDAAASNADYLALINADVDAFLNRESNHCHDLGDGILDENDNENKAMIPKLIDPADEYLYYDMPCELPTGDITDHFNLFGSTDRDPLLISGEIKSERRSDSFMSDNADFGHKIAKSSHCVTSSNMYNIQHYLSTGTLLDVVASSSEMPDHCDSSKNTGNVPKFTCSSTRATSSVISSNPSKRSRSTHFLSKQRLHSDTSIPMSPYEIVTGMQQESPQLVPSNSPLMHAGQPLSQFTVANTVPSLNSTSTLSQRVFMSNCHSSPSITNNVCRKDSTASNVESLPTVAHRTLSPLSLVSTTSSTISHHATMKLPTVCLTPSPPSHMSIPNPLMTSCPRPLTPIVTAQLPLTIPPPPHGAPGPILVPLTEQDPTPEELTMQLKKQLEELQKQQLEHQKQMAKLLNGTSGASVPPPPPVALPQGPGQIITLPLLPHSLRPPPGYHDIARQPVVINTQAEYSQPPSPAVKTPTTISIPTTTCKPEPPKTLHLLSHHHLPLTPLSSSESNSVPNSPITHRDSATTLNNSRCTSPDVLNKPSDSTKRLILALTEKLKRNQHHRITETHDGKVSFNDISDMLKESMMKESSLSFINSLNENDKLSVMDTKDLISTHKSDTPSHTIHWQTTTSNTLPPVSTFSTSHNGEKTLSRSQSLPLTSHILLHSNPHHSSLPPTPPAGSITSSPIRSLNTIYLADPTKPVTPPQSPEMVTFKDGETVPYIIQPQDPFITPTFTAMPGTPSRTPSVSAYPDLTSPDSGFNESCVSPADSNTMFGDSDSGTDISASRVGKRRRSSSLSLSKAVNIVPKPNAPIIIPKLEYDSSGYKYTMETSTSTSQKIEEDKMTYMNKGQFYAVTLECLPEGRPLPNGIVKSLVCVVFREEKVAAEELKAWEFWHSRQHSVKQRIFDIDTKNSMGVIPNGIDEVAHNAILVRWNPSHGPAKISVAINCLSTDFSNQKGVKGLPLHVQIDTFEDCHSFPVHRGFCQVKVFCDKGAERKTRDEERRKEAKTKSEPGSSPGSSPDGSFSPGSKMPQVYHPTYERSDFYHMADLSIKPVLFNPIIDYNTSSPFDPFLSMSSGRDDELLLSPTKRCRLDSTGSRVLLYVRENHETIYTALLLQSPTIPSLAQAIEEKYTIPACNIHNIYKRSKKGIMVKMDDNIIRHYTNETTFVISITKNEQMLDCDAYDVTLMEITGD